MNTLHNFGFKQTAVVALLAITLTTAHAQGNGNNQPSGQAPTQTATNVVVTNTSGQPVPIKDQDNPALQPFQTYGGVSMLGNNINASFQIAVPAGKRLVIEQVSAIITGESTGAHPYFQVASTAAGIPAYTRFTTPSALADNSLTLFMGVQAVHIYADGGTNVTITAYKTTDMFGSYTNTAFSGQITVSGYLVNVP